MNSLIDQIEDILLRDVKIHNEYGEDLTIENFNEIAVKIYSLCYKHSKRQLDLRDDFILDKGLWKEFVHSIKGTHND